MKTKKTKTKKQKNKKTKTKKEIVPSGFEPLSPAPKAGMIDHYTTGLHKNYLKKEKVA